MDIQKLNVQTKTIFIDRISYLEQESPGIYHKHLNKPEIIYLIAFLIMATYDDPNQKQIVHDYIDGIILIECGKIEEGKGLMERGVQSLHDFSGSEIVHKNFINAFIDPMSKITEGVFSFDIKESLGKYLKDNKVKLDSEEKFNLSLAKLLNERRDWVKEIDSLKETDSGLDTLKDIEEDNRLKEGASIKKLALLLYFTNESFNSHDFNLIANEYKFKNGEKLKKTFSLFKKLIRRNGNCFELDSVTKKENRVLDYEWAIERLPSDKKGKAIDEMKTLQSKIYVEE